MQTWVQKNGFGDDNALLDYAYSLATHYGEAIGTLSCQMYEATAAAQGIAVKSAEIASLPEYGEVAKAVNGAKKRSEKLVPSTVGRLVKQVGADTTLHNAIRDHAEFAWIPSGDTCGYCLTLASRGWQQISKKTLKKGHAEHIHANCDCQYAIRFDGKSTVEGYDPDKYLEQYENAEGRTPEEKINSMRRANYIKNKSEINAQKRAAYAARKSSTALAKNDMIDAEEDVINAAGQQVKSVTKITLTAEPNSITQVINAKGGIDRNYYGADGRQIKQISNHDHGKPKQHPYGEHAHDYSYDENGNLIRGRERPLNEAEREENADFL